MYGQGQVTERLEARRGRASCCETAGESAAQGSECAVQRGNRQVSVRYRVGVCDIGEVCVQYRGMTDR